jgi:hypothetical protein
MAAKLLMALITFVLVLLVIFTSYNNPGETNNSTAPPDNQSTDYTNNQTDVPVNEPVLPDTDNVSAPVSGGGSGGGSSGGSSSSSSSSDVPDSGDDIVVGPSNVIRSLSAGSVPAGGEIEVSLAVTVNVSDFYAIDDILPPGWTVSDPGNGSDEEPGHWKVAVLENATNVTYEYTATAPGQSGNYFFSGDYMFEQMNESAPIAGDSGVTVY